MDLTHLVGAFQEDIIPLHSHLWGLRSDLDHGSHEIVGDDIDPGDEAVHPGLPLPLLGHLEGLVPPGQDGRVAQLGRGGAGSAADKLFDGQ